MLRPTREEFHQLAADHTVVPVWRELLADLITPVAAFARLCGDDQPGFLFESVEHGERWSRWSFVGRNPLATLVLRDGVLEVTGDLPEGMPTDQGILTAVEWMLERYRSPVLDDLPPLHGGLVGYLGYDVVREVEHLPDVPHDATGYPDAALSVIGQLAAFDHFRQRVTLIDNVLLPDDADEATVDRLYDEALVRLDRLAIDGARPLAEPMVEPPDRDPVLPEVTGSVSAEQYGRAVEVAKEHILAGDIFQVVLSQRFSFPLEADPFDFYRVLRQVNPSPYMYFVRTPELSLAGSSPEPMVKLVDGQVISRPIAGTRRRGATDEDDRRLGAELREHPKELAEHVMLVDLARNDVGRVVKFGTEKLDEMMVLERYSHVMHLTSQVSGELADGQDPHRRAAGHAARRHGVGRSQGAGDGDHRRPRAGEAGPLRRGGRLHRLLRHHRHRHRHPHARGRGRRHRPRAGRRRHRGRLRARARGPRVPQQGRRPAVGRAWRPADDRPAQGRHPHPALTLLPAARKLAHLLRRAGRREPPFREATKAGSPASAGWTR